MPTVVDTVVAHYFLLVREFDLLLELLDQPVVVSRIVYDPDDHERMDDTAVSEITRNLRHELRLARQPRTPPDVREDRLNNAASIRLLQDLVDKGRVEVVDMTEEELDLFSRLTAREPDSRLGLLLPLGVGEAASIAIAVERGYVLATDDTDALRALEVLDPGHPYERIRRLLVRATDEGRLSPGEANALHDRMREYGFWDSVRPFPEG